MRSRLAPSLWAASASVAAAGLYPWLFAPERMGRLVSALVLYHALGGLILAAILGAAWTRLAPALRLPFARRAAAILLAAIAISGAAMLACAASGRSVSLLGPLLALHTWLGAGVTIVGCAAIGRNLLSWRRGRSAATAGALLAASAVGLASISYDAEATFRRVTATNAAQAGNPLFPAGAIGVSREGWAAVESNGRCGDGGCHPEVHRRWMEGAHASLTLPHYRSGKPAVDYSAATLGESPESRYCQGCHQPASLVAGKEILNSGCLNCHAMRSVPEPAGNGLAVYQPPADYSLTRTDTAASRWARRFLVRLRPDPHRATLTAPASPGSIACAPCHRSAVPVALNQYRFLREDNTWAEWQSGPWSGESAHQFRSGPARGCIDCHADAVHGPARRKPGDGGMSVEVFAVRRQRSRLPEQLIAPLRGLPAIISPGETVTIDILVTNRAIGHDFGGGVAGPIRAQLAVQATDAALSYAADPTFAPSAGRHHLYGLQNVDRQGAVVRHSNGSTAIATAFRRTIPAGAAEVVRYRYTAPRTPGSRIRIHAMLRRFSSRGHDAGKAEDSATVVVAGDSRRPLSPLFRGVSRDDADDAPRFVLYGRGLAARREFGRARQALQQARTLAPNRAETWTAIGQTYLDEGDFLAARQALEKAAAMQPGNPAPLAWLGRVLRLMGQYEAALVQLKALSARFPRDAELWFDSGLCLLQSGRYEEAIRDFAQMAAIDPDNPAAHYNLMQCYRRLRRLSDARREEVIYRALRDEEPPASVVDRYYQKLPDARLESQPVHDHVLAPGMLEDVPF